MREFEVSVHNEQTGEVTSVRIAAGSALAAQIEALEEVFAVRGWRKALAQVPVPLENVA